MSRPMMLFAMRMPSQVRVVLGEERGTRLRPRGATRLTSTQHDDPLAGYERRTVRPDRHAGRPAGFVARTGQRGMVLPAAAISRWVSVAPSGGSVGGLT